MIQVYKDKPSGHWVAECTSLGILGEGLNAADAIDGLCNILRSFLIESHRKGSSLFKKENIHQMVARHENEVEELRNTCEHKDVGECEPFRVAPGCISTHCVRICKFCGEERFTTYEGVPMCTKEGKTQFIHRPPEEKIFVCDKGMHCEKRY